MPDNILEQWNDVLQGVVKGAGAVRRLNLGPPMVARLFAIVGTAAYEAWRVYDDTAKSTFLNPIARRPAGEHTTPNKEKAISFAIYRVLVDLVPTVPNPTTGLPLNFITLLVNPFMANHVFDITDTSQNGTSPSRIGNKVAATLLATRHNDGANQLGDEPGTPPTTDGLPNYYADYDKGAYNHYVSANDPIFVEAFTLRSQIKDFTRWQVLRYLDATNTVQSPGYIGPHWGNVKSFALLAADQFRPGPPITDPTKQAFVDQARHVIDIQANLDETTMGIAEFWADGPKSSLPPGHWFDHGIWTSERDNLSLDDTVRLMFALANAVFDASISVWEAKRHYDYVRPITAIRYLFSEAMIPGWKGSGRGFGQVQGAIWRPFQRSTFPTPPFPEYVSGHSGFSAAAAEVLKQFTGSDVFNRTDTISAPLAAEPSVPTRVIYLHWPTFSDAAQQAGESRLYGGIHFYEGNMAGLALGRQVGAQAFEHAQGHWLGTKGY